MYYGSFRWPDVRDALRSKWLVIPVGSVEQHGPHLPLNVDTVLAEKFAEMLARELDAVVSPPIGYGCRSLPHSGGGPRYPGTIRLTGSTFSALFKEILVEYLRNGAQRIVVLNGHWENEAFLLDAIEECREEGRLDGSLVVALSWWSVITEQEMVEVFGRFDGWHVEHASQAETALMLAFAPELVNMELAVDNDSPVHLGVYCHPTPVNWTGNRGVLGTSTHVDREMGQRLARRVIQRITRVVGSLGTSGDIDQRDRS